MDCTVVLAAAESRWFSFYSDFTDKPVDLEPVARALIVLTIASVIFAILFHLSQKLSGRRNNSPLGLFLALCRAHRLSWREMWLLWRVAAAHQLPDPARLFVEIEWYDSAQLPQRLRTYSSQLAGLRDRLIGLPAEQYSSIADQGNGPNASVRKTTAA